MMDWGDWSKVEEWIASMWPGRAWPDGSVAKVREAVPDVTSEDDVWVWLNSYRDTDSKHPPSPAEVISGVKGVVRRRLKTERGEVKALPGGAVGNDALARYLERIGVSSFAEAVEYEATRRGLWDEEKAARYRASIGKGTR